MDLDKIDAPDYKQWQLKRITKRNLPLAGINRIEHSAESHVYIIDTGIDAAHVQLSMHVA